MPYGSLGYGSPEQAAGERGATIGRTSSASGSLLYEMVTGHAPFRRPPPVEVLHAVINQAPRPMCALNPRGPAGAAAILDRALAKDPEDRYQTMAALRDELKALMRRLPRGRPRADRGLGARPAGRARAAPGALGSGLGRVFGRRRTPAEPLRGADTDAAPARAHGGPARPPSLGHARPSRRSPSCPSRTSPAIPQADFYEFSLADGAHHRARAAPLAGRAPVRPTSPRTRARTSIRGRWARSWRCTRCWRAASSRPRTACA